MRPFHTLLLVALATCVFAATSVAQERPQNPSPAVTDPAFSIGAALREKADQGDQHAQASLGIFADLAGDHTLAAMWYPKAADQGNALAQGSLGSLYRSGDGVPQDFREAYKSSRAAADQGDPLGELNLAGLHVLGQDRPVDEREATKWAREAAEQDCETKSRIAAICAQAQALLGAAYLEGKGVPQDYLLAHMWANLAAAMAPAGDAQKHAIAPVDASACETRSRQSSRFSA